MSEGRSVLESGQLSGMRSGAGSSAVRLTARSVPSILWDATMEDEEQRREGDRARRWWVWGLGSTLLVVAAGLALFVVLSPRLRRPLLGRQERVVLTAIENQTGDPTFDGSVATALRLELGQSPYLRLKSSGDYRVTMRQMGANDTSSRATAREVAKRLGSRLYLYGSISGAGAPYTVRVSLWNVDTDKVLATVQESAGSREQLGPAMDRLATALRSTAGEEPESIARTQVPLAQEATGNFEALQQYTKAEALMGSGHLVEAMNGFLQAVTLDPHFPQAWLRLTTLYRVLRADVAAEDAARRALAASAGSSEHTRLLAQFESEMNADFDYAQATATVQEMLKRYPQDIAAKADHSRLLRLQGRLTEALQAAEQAATEDPLDMASNVQAQQTMVAMDHYDGALHVQLHLERLGILTPSAGLTAGYLAGRQDVVDQASAWVKTTKTFIPEWREYGLYLDNTGRLEQSMEVWQTTAAMAGQIRTLESAGSTMLAQGALDHALAGDCKGGLDMARSAGAAAEGHDATFNAGMAFALCGERAAAEQAVTELQRRYPQSTAEKGYLIADLRGAMALQAGDPAAALELLKPARQYDLMSLTPFLRGRAHVALGQIEVGIVDFQTVLSHRGITFNVGTNVYPMAQIGVARAFALSGDPVNSADAYRRFLEIWKDADRKQPLLVEAMAKSKAAPPATARND
jgi:serine/threonine-protein kinase